MVYKTEVSPWCPKRQTMLKREIHGQETPKSLTWGVSISLQSWLALFFFPLFILTNPHFLKQDSLVENFMRLPSLVLCCSPMPAYVCMQVYLERECSGADVSTDTQKAEDNLRCHPRGCHHLPPLRQVLSVAWSLPLC